MFQNKGGFEAFTGGGTTCVAAKLIARSFIGFEIDPKQAEIARERLATMQLPLFDVRVSQLPLEEGGVVAIVSEEAS